MFRLGLALLRIGHLKGRDTASSHRNRREDVCESTWRSMARLKGLKKNILGLAGLGRLGTMYMRGSLDQIAPRVSSHAQGWLLVGFAGL